ncbi:aminotransferase class V-fold PLP-dependent enzyme [Spirochaetota bacterium]
MAEAVSAFITNAGANINRSGFDSAFAAEETVFETRELLCSLFNFSRPENVVFCLNATAALNYILKGLLKAGEHCLVSGMEHNAVMRPLNQLAKEGVDFSAIPCNKKGELLVPEIKGKIRKNTKAFVLTHASNVSGTIMPLEEAGKICAEEGLFFIVDAAQTAGLLPIDFKAIKAHALVFPGHKGLLGPQGIGGFAIEPGLAEKLTPLLSGGTGSRSESEEQPEYLPDKFESGTQNLPGIAGLNEALKYIQRTGLSAIREKEMLLTKALMDGLDELAGDGRLRILGLAAGVGRTAVVSVDFFGRDNADVGHALYTGYGIRTRCGLHCAPRAHKTLGSFPGGSVRISPGFFNTLEDIDYALFAIAEILKKK